MENVETGQSHMEELRAAARGAALWNAEMGPCGETRAVKTTIIITPECHKEAAGHETNSGK